jgi:DNA-binding NarL/FixJ family response regulator
MADYNIILAEPSYLLRLGLVQILDEINISSNVYEFSNLDNALQSLNQNYIHVFFVNPGLDDYDPAKMVQIKADSPNIKIVALSKQDAQMPGFFDGLISLADCKSELYKKMDRIFKSAQVQMPESSNDRLSQREITILTLVAQGFTNQEIADKSFISAHTVISHRKNISRKLGIKTVAGLTVYAILNNLIDGSEIH